MIPSQPILSVIGPHSGCGKTTFVVHLLRHIDGLGTLKISPAYEWPAPFSLAEDGTEQDFFLEDSAHLNRPGKDTALYLEAGAVQVERLRHRRDGLAAGLRAALKRYPPNVPVVVESSSTVKLLTPVAVVLVVRPPIREMKLATREVLPLVTDLLINLSDHEGLDRISLPFSPTPADPRGLKPAARYTESSNALAKTETGRLESEFPSLRPQHTWSADLIHEPPPEEMLNRLRTLLAPDRP